MTCIVGIKEGGKLWMGGDSAAGSPPATEIYTVAAPKIFAVDQYLVGYTMSFRAGQVVQHEAEWPTLPAEIDLDRFMVREVVPRLRRALREAGALKTSEGVDHGAHFLIGVRGVFYSVGVDFSAVATVERYMAIGSGRHHAYGALHALAEIQMFPETRIQKALEAASRFSSNVGPPFSYLSMGGTTS